MEGPFSALHRRSGQLISEGGPGYIPGMGLSCSIVYNSTMQSTIGPFTSPE